MGVPTDKFHIWREAITGGHQWVVQLPVRWTPYSQSRMTHRLSFDTFEQARASVAWRVDDYAKRGKGKERW